ncbi:MAG TPA: hemolysin family protein [Myxococcaceae bacterium]|nr:hemolysin family protein [Myxococcaceae bacterium]
MTIWAMWLAVLGFLLVRALLAGAESALYSLSELRAKELFAIYPDAGRRVLRLKTEREATAAALRVGLVLAGFSAAALGAIAPPHMLDFSRYASSPWVVWATALSSAALVGLLASLMDVSARSIASANPDRWALRLSWVVALLTSTLYPVMRALVGVVDLLTRPFGRRIRFESPTLPLEELEKLLAAQAANAQVDQGAPQLIRSIFELSDKRCRDVMVPRTEVISLDVTTAPPEILRILAEENHSRIPVYQDDIDHIVGVLHARDLIPLLQHPELIVLPDIIRPAHFVPWMKPIGDLLREMQKKKIHMAMVVDEYGGFMGIVTLEDILREIVGDIPDEFEVEEKLIDKQADGSYLVDAGLEGVDFAKAFSFSLPDGDYDTLGGFLSSLAGSLPEVGERFAFNGWQFIIHSKEGPRLRRIRLVKPRGTSGAAKEKDLRTAT